VPAPLSFRPECLAGDLRRPWLAEPLRVARFGRTISIWQIVGAMPAHPADAPRQRKTLRHLRIRQAE